MIAIVVFWLFLALVVAVAAGTRGRTGLGWFILSVILSPLIGLILVLVLPDRRQERLIARMAATAGDVRSGPFEPEGIYADIPYRALSDGSVEALMQGAIVRFRSVEHLTQTIAGVTPPFQQSPAADAFSAHDRRTGLGSFGMQLGKVFLVGGIVVIAIAYFFNSQFLNVKTGGEQPSGSRLTFESGRGFPWS
jgi:hypothetical protein